MAPETETVEPPCGPELPPAPSGRQQALIREMLLRLDDALVTGAPVEAQQRLLSDLAVYAALLVHSRKTCSFDDAAFLGKLSALESAFARRGRGVDAAHLEEIRRWFAKKFAEELP